MEAIASKLDAVQLQLAQLASSHESTQGTLAVLHSSLSMSKSADGPVQHCQKLARFADDSASPLDKDELLDKVFGYVGLGEYIYAAGVSRRWRGRYLRICYTEAGPAGEKLCTYYSSAIITTVRLQMALDSKLTMAALEQYSSFAEDLVWYSLDPVNVITLAKVYDMKWSPRFTSTAARSDNLELLKWLHKVGCPWDVVHVMQAAARHYTACMLRWLHSLTKPWSAEIAKKVMWCAAQAGTTDTLKFVRSTGVEWPSRFYEEPFGRCWPVRAVLTALADGCAWGEWKCADLAPDLFYCISEGGTHKDDDCIPYCDRKYAVELFAWAHQNGCPCTCEADAADAAAAAVQAAAAAV
eukprot:16003-Heterococcus_DN1.PRE.3